MSKIKEALSDFFDDLTTIEVALIEPSEGETEKATAIAYSKIEFEGDMINLIDSSKMNSDSSLGELYQTIIQTSIKSRTSLINMIFTALYGN